MLKLLATVTLLLSLFIVSVPNGNSQTNSYISDAKIFITWEAKNTIPNEILNSTGATMSGALLWDGDITLSSGQIKVVRPLFDAEGDRLISKEAPISFQSETLPGDKDGIYISITNATADSVLDINYKYQTPLRIALSDFIAEKEKTVTNDYSEINLTLEDRSLDKGSLTTQFDTWMREILRPCLTEGKTEATCTQDLRYTIGKEKHLLWAKKYAELNKEGQQLISGTGTLLQQGDALLFLPASQLKDAIRTNRERLSTSDLADLNGRLTSALQEVDYSLLTDLPEKLQTKRTILEGDLPQSTIDKGLITGDIYTKWSSALKGLNDVEKIRLLEVLQKLQPDLYATLNDLNLRALSIGLHRLAAFPRDLAYEHIERYVNQLSTVSNLRNQFDQVKDFLSNSDGILCDQALHTLETEYFYKSDLTPIIYKKLGELFSTIKAKTRDQISLDVQGIVQDLATAHTQSELAKQKEGLLDFKDVEDGSWYSVFVRQAKTLGIIAGYKDETGQPTGFFGPDNSLTVGELLKITMEIADIGPDPTANGSNWADGYLVAAKESGITLARSSNLDLNRKATRAEVVQSMLEAFGIYPPSIDKTDFTDVSPLPLYGKYIQYAKDLNIVSGDDVTGTFRPNDPINRAEVAKIISNIYYYIRYPLEVSQVSGDLSE